MPSNPTDPAAPSLAGIAVGDLVIATGDGLTVAEAPSVRGQLVGYLNAGQPALVVDGPVAADGAVWVLLSGLGLPPNAGCEEPVTIADCPGWLGWTPVSDGTVTLQPTTVACPDLSAYDALAGATPIVRLVCATGRSIDVTAWWAGPSPYHTCIDSPPGVDWLFCAPALTGWFAPAPDMVGIAALPVAVDPASPVTVPAAGQWARVVGHVDDPASGACAVVPGAPDAELAGWGQVLQCRSTLVAESMSPVDAP